MLCRHLSRRHGAKYKEYLRSTQPSQPEPTQSSIVNFTAGAGSQSSDSTATRSFSTSTYSRTSTRAKHLTQSLLDNVIIGCGLPVSLVDHPKFCKFLSDMDARYDRPCRQTVTQTLVPKSVQTQKDALRAELDKCNSISLTTNVWTDRRMHAYLGVTVHALVGGNPKSNLLAFRTLTGSHTGQRIADEIDAVVREFDVKDKIRCVVTDNASNMLKAMYLFFTGADDSSYQAVDAQVDDALLWEDLPEDEVEAAISDTGGRIACFAHSLQLVVRGGLEKAATVLRPAMGKVSKLANVAHQSQLFRSAYEEKFGTGKSIPATNDTRWNSVYRQLQVIVDMDQTKLADLLRESSQAPSFHVLQEVVDLLHPFAEATDLTQGENILTISAVIPTILSLRILLRQMSTSVRFHAAAVQELLNQLHERFFHVLTRINVELPPTACTSRTLAFDSDVFMLASAIDPQYGFRWLQDHPGAADVKDGLRHRITGRIYD